ncbi:MAG: hypothetical protein IJ077_08450 [Eubacterium sp.]|nr:hypothetical protein [Eubacterium sp.]
MANRLTVYFYNQTRGEILTLPINPDAITLPQQINIERYNVIDYGEVAIFGTRQLKTVTINSIFLNDNAGSILTTTYTNILTGVINNLITKQSTISKLQAWQEAKDLIRVVISDHFNELMKITRFEPVVSESTKVIHYQIDFLEYRDPIKDTSGGSILSILASGLVSRNAIRTLASTVTAKASDDLYSIATRYTGDSANWTTIAEKNGLSIDSDIVGKVLRL